jgi:hypothetical protein
LKLLPRFHRWLRLEVLSWLKDTNTAKFLLIYINLGVEFYLDIERTIDEIETEIDLAWQVPISGGKVLLNVIIQYGP